MVKKDVIKTLVWITNSFRTDSRLMSNLSGLCSFVYYSPYYFAGQRERQIYEKCNQENLDSFYYSLHQFNSQLKDKQNKLYIFKVNDPINHINGLIKKYGFTNVVIDQPLFAMWHSIKLDQLNVPFKIIDSALIDDNCIKMTAKSRWMSHIKNINKFKPHKWNTTIHHLKLNEKIATYPKPKVISEYLNTEKLLERLKTVALNYSETRDRFNGQTQLSTLLHNGLIDPHNLFLNTVALFKNRVNDFLNPEEKHVPILRQFAFREISIITARVNNLTLEDSVKKWAKILMHHTAYENLINSKPNPKSELTFDKIKNSNTGIAELDSILKPFNKCLIMPNRARMYYAGKIFYESKTGLSALELLIDTFDLIGLDGQSPNNYTQSISALGLSYGKVMLMSAERTFKLLGYKIVKNEI